MLKPGIPSNEASRIQMLRDLLILDTPPEERFDALTIYATYQFKVPIALVSLVDENRQWFKSKCGLGGSETTRDVSFCAHAILGDDVLMIPDAAADPRFADNPLVTGEPGIRFYAGCPLAVEGGYRVGTFCLIDRRPRRLDEWELGHLRLLATVAAQEVQGISATEDFMKTKAVGRA